MTGPLLENKKLVKKIDAFALVNFLLHGFRDCTGRALPFTYCGHPPHFHFTKFSFEFEDAPKRPFRLG